MKKQEFLAVLRDRLRGLPQEDIDKSIDYYSEMIDDRMEDGLKEETAVAALGSMDEIVSQILKEIPFSKIVKAKVKQKRKMNAGIIVLLILGFPVWFPLLVAAISVTFAVYASIWAVVISLYAATVSVAAVSVAGIVGFFIYLASGKALAGIVLLGGGIACAGLAILFFFGCNLVTKGVLVLGKSIVLALKRLLIGKEKRI